MKTIGRALTAMAASVDGVWSPFDADPGSGCAFRGHDDTVPPRFQLDNLAATSSSNVHSDASNDNSANLLNTFSSGCATARMILSMRWPAVSEPAETRSGLFFGASLCPFLCLPVCGKDYIHIDRVRWLLKSEEIARLFPFKGRI